MWKIAAVGWFIIEAVLSHTPGEKSGEESRTLSQLTGIDESFLRRSAHVFLFMIMALLAGMGFGWIGVGITAVWGIIDEISKRRVSGRHCSAFDILLNLCGCAAGMTVWLLVGEFFKVICCFVMVIYFWEAVSHRLHLFLSIS